MFNFKRKKTEDISELKLEISKLRDEVKNLTANQVTQANFMASLTNSVTLHINTCNGNFLHLQQRISEVSIISRGDPDEDNNLIN